MHSTYSCSMTMFSKNSVGLSSWENTNQIEINQFELVKTNIYAYSIWFNYLLPTILGLQLAPRLAYHHFYSAQIQNMDALRLFVLEMENIRGGAVKTHYSSPVEKVRYWQYRITSPAPYFRQQSPAASLKKARNTVNQGKMSFFFFFCVEKLRS